MPYRYCDDIATADVAFTAWGRSREELFVAAAEALLGAMTAEPALVRVQEELTLSLADDQLDLLLFAFLQELVFLKDARRLLLHALAVTIREEGGMFALTARLGGELINPARHRLLVDVKAVTLHRLAVVQRVRGWQATVVLDI